MTDFQFQLDMVPHEDDPPEELKLPISFYYSSCYYMHNKHRLHKRYQVSRGNTSWDVSIARLQWKGEPRMDIAIKEPPCKWTSLLKALKTIFANSMSAETDGGSAWVAYIQDDNDDYYYHQSDDEDNVYLGGLAYFLSQFKQYHGLTMQLYNDEGLQTSSEFEDYVSRLQKILVGPQIGPQKGPNFVESGPYADVVGGY
jgi:hypothetical protein